MATTTVHVVGVIHLLAALYALLAILFTTNYFLMPSIQACLSLVLDTITSPARQGVQLSRNHAQETVRILADIHAHLQSYEHKDSLIHWNTHASKEPLAVSEQLFLSKAFSHYMQPSKIIPYFYRAAGNIDAEDITVTTQITSNRLHVFERLVKQYEGPISVTIHVKNQTTHIHDFLDSLHALYTSSTLIAHKVDVHLVIDAFDRQFNTWRNIARFFARTDYVMMLDIDFYLCTDFRRAMRANRDAMKMLKEGYSAFVIPAFEYLEHEEGVDYEKFPRDKQALISLVKKRKISMFHATWEGGHNSTNYSRYYNAKPGEVYKVTDYQPAYEPYVVFKKEGPPWCDERFVGYGGNKAACLFEMYLYGTSFYVMADHFMIHQNHLYEEKTRKNERKFNKKIYTEFKEESCIRYLNQFEALEQLHTERGQNLLAECRRIKGVSAEMTKISKKI